MELSVKEKRLICNSLEYALKDLESYMDDIEDNIIVLSISSIVSDSLKELLIKFKKELKEN